MSCNKVTITYIYIHYIKKLYKVVVCRYIPEVTTYTYIQYIKIIYIFIILYHSYMVAVVYVDLDTHLKYTS